MSIADQPRSILHNVKYSSEEKLGFRIDDILSPEFGYKRTTEKNLAMCKLFLQLQYQGISARIEGLRFSNDHRSLTVEQINNNLIEGQNISEDHDKSLYGHFQYMDRLVAEQKLWSKDSSVPRDPSLSPPKEYSWLKSTRYSDRPSSKNKHRKSKRRLSSDLNSPPGSNIPSGFSKTEVNDSVGNMAENETVEDRRHRTAFTSEQLSLLHDEFNHNAYLTEDRRLRLAHELNLTETQIKIWFQNRRAKLKKSSLNWETNPQSLHTSLLSM